MGREGRNSGMRRKMGMGTRDGREREEGG